jgi:hypothetical protein
MAMQGGSPQWYGCVLRVLITGSIVRYFGMLLHCCDIKTLSRLAPWGCPQRYVAMTALCDLPVFFALAVCSLYGCWVSGMIPGCVCLKAVPCFLCDIRVVDGVWLWRPTEIRFVIPRWSRPSYTAVCMAACASLRCVRAPSRWACDIGGFILTRLCPSSRMPCNG